MRWKSRIRNVLPSLISLLWLLTIVAGIIYLMRRCASNDPGETKIEPTAIQVQSVRKIAEMAVLKWQEELVLDSVEYFRNGQQKMAAKSLQIRNPYRASEVLNASNVKRRLTLIVEVEAKMGVDLSKCARIAENKDSVWIHLPRPEVLSYEANPTQTKIFIETGAWDDRDKKEIMKGIRLALNERLNRKEIKQRIQLQLHQLFESLLNDDRTVLVYFDC